MSTTEQLYQIADELRAVAAMGLRFGTNGYDTERYEHVMRASARLVAAVESRSPDEIYTQFRDDLLHLSPLAGVEIAVFHASRLLLVQRRDDKLWALPGGLCEVGETLAQAAERELEEEAGIRGRATQLLGVFDSRLWQTRTKVHLYSAMFLVESEDQPMARVGPRNSTGPKSETLDAGFFEENTLPELSQGHHIRVPTAFKIHRGEILAPYFDKVL